MHAIEVDGLRKAFAGGVEAVKGIDFEVAPGEVFGLLGPNGAGKSTTIGMLTTTIAPTGGTARLAAFDAAPEPLAARAVSSVVFQDAVVDRALTGRRNLEIHARVWKVPAREAGPRLAEVPGTVGLDPRIRAELLDVIADLRSRFEMTVLLTTHYLDEADRLCDRIAVMHRGAIVATDSPQGLRGRLGRELVEL